MVANTLAETEAAIKAKKDALAKSLPPDEQISKETNLINNL